jgi:hypothetical protein
MIAVRYAIKLEPVIKRGTLSLGLLKGDTASVLCKPRIGSLQRRVQRTGEANVASAAEDVIEVALELKHVAKIISSRETEAAIDVG